MVLAIIHTYQSQALELSLRYHLQLDNDFLDQFLIVFCRWNTFPDLGIDPNIDMIKEKFSHELESNHIKIINHLGKYDHNEFECREMIMNSFLDKERIWIDSDELLTGRFWYLNHCEENTAYMIKHLIITSNGVQDFKGIPYLFGKNVSITYNGNHFLKLECFVNNQKIDPVYIPEFMNLSIQLVEGNKYKEAKKNWLANW